MGRRKLRFRNGFPHSIRTRWSIIHRYFLRLPDRADNKLRLTRLWTKLGAIVASLALLFVLGVLANSCINPATRACVSEMSPKAEDYEQADISGPIVKCTFGKPLKSH